MQNHFLPLLSVTEQSALACYPFIGRGKAMEADQAAVLSMRSAFNNLPLSARIVIGEGERDKAPRLYSGEELGDIQSSLKIDAAVDPLEGTALCAHGKPGALSVMALGKRGDVLKAPDIYMKKIACGPKAKNLLHLEAKISENLKNLSRALEKPLKEITVGVLNRSRHENLIEEIRKTGARVRLAEDGDVALALNTALDSSPLDLLVGTGGAPEGALAASGLKCLGGDFQGRLIFKDKKEEERALKAGVRDLHKVWSSEELVRGETCFCATGVTTGDILPGIKKTSFGFISHSLILTNKRHFTVKNRHLISTRFQNE